MKKAFFDLSKNLMFSLMYIKFLVEGGLEILRSVLRLFLLKMGQMAEKKSGDQVRYSTADCFVVT